MVSLDHFDSLISSQSLLKHPFYQMWNKGELSMADMRVYAKEYFHLARRVPGIVSRVRDRAVEARPDMLPMIEENIAEETVHIDLWKRFAKSLDISEEELMAYIPSQTVQDAVADLEEACEGTFEEGAAAMYALEKELPEIAQTKKDGLCAFYGLESEDAHIYFDEHLKEAKHLQVWLSVDVEKETVEPAVRRSLFAQNRVLDGVCEVCGIEVDCSCEA